MNQPARWIQNSEREIPVVQPAKRIPFVKLFMRYPFFLLALGPPIFRVPIVGSDTSQAHFDFWSIFQVGWISLIALRALLRLAAAHSINIPKRVRSILKLAFYLGLLFLLSVTYSPGRIVSLEFSALYFMTLICVVEFVVDTYRDPPDWYQCVLHFRLVSLLVYILVILTLPFAPNLVMQVIPGAGVRLLGGAVGSPTTLCPIIAIISAYSFRHSLEPRFRSTVLFLVGLAGSLITQSRGTDIALLIVLAILVIGWGRASKRSANTFIALSMTSLLLTGVVLGAIGGDRIWNTFNRGQDAASIASGSGRTEIWSFAIQYCLTHPQGMGYVAGFRSIFTKHFDLNFVGDVTRLGTSHNAYIQYLVDGGWLGLALYLFMLAKIFAVGMRFTKRGSLAVSTLESSTVHAIRCGLLLLVYCLADGMDTSVFNIPLQEPFYYQNIIVAIILGACATMLVNSRPRYASIAR